VIAQLAPLLRAIERRRAAAAAVAIAVLVAAAIAIGLHHDPFVPLFAAPLQPDQLAEVADTLAAWNVPYLPAADNVRIDAARRSQTLLRLSIAGVPRSHALTRGEALAKANALTPQAVLDAEASEGLAAEIAVALRGLPGIREARVIVAPAKPAAFADEDAHAASAAVRLSLEPGAALDARVASGIRRFVAAAVPGLDAGRVALLDDRASPLGESGATENDRQTALQSALDGAFGSGSTIVRVREEYDAVARVVHDASRRPAQPEPVTATLTDERYANERKSWSKHSASEDRGAVLHDERDETQRGALLRISVAVAVDRAAHLDLTAVRGLARGAAGIDDRRGDSLAVEEVDFARGAPADATPHYLAWLAAVLPIAAAVAAGLVALRWFAAPIAALGEAAAARLRIAGVERAVSGYAPAQVAGILNGEPPHTAAAIISALPAATAAAVLDLYPADMRAAIVRRMSRSRGEAVPDLDAILRRG
jgi:flagellar M-ring protein FliF